MTSNQIKRGLKWICCALVGLLIATFILPGLGQMEALSSQIEVSPGLDLGLPESDTSLTPVNLDDRPAFEAFVDSVFSQELESNRAPGGAIAVVKDGELLFAKGYGYANVEQQTPVQANTTLFRVASISKMFTATAIMQLQEKGLLKLDDPVSAYLGDTVQLDNPFEDAVTFKQLLLQTDGSTKRRIGLAADTEARLQPLERYLADHLPPITYPPGELFNYSSHSFALLGYLVQQISGQPFVDYVAENILQPLEMERSSFAQPTPQQDDLATGYRKSGNAFKPVPYLYLNIGPGAALSSTATDIAHFMIAHLQDGRYRNAQILRPESVADMHEIHFRPHPKLSGTGYTFRERRVNDMTTVGHLGSLRGYSSSLTLIPEQNLGIFVVSNSLSGVHGKLLRQFFDRYFPAESAAAVLPAAALNLDKQDLNKFTGIYRDLEFPRHTLAKLSAPFAHIHIRRTSTGLQIQTPSLFFRDPPPQQQLTPVEPFLFRQQDGTLTAFELDSDGNVTYAHNPIFSKMATYEKIAWYENPWLHLAILGGAVLLFITAVWTWPIRSKGSSLKTTSTGVAWGIACLASSLNLVFLVGFSLSLFFYGTWKLVYGVPWFVAAFLVLPIVSLVLTIGMVGFVLWSWVRGQWSIVKRLHYSAIALAAALFMALLSYWNVLGFQI